MRCDGGDPAYFSYLSLMYHFTDRHPQILFGDIDSATEARLAQCQEVLTIIESCLPPPPSRTGQRNGHAAGPAAMDETADKGEAEEEEEEEEEEASELVHEPAGRGVEDDDAAE